jgi:hypothetical protein
MKKSELKNITILEKFHKEIYRQQEENHSEHYCAIHHAVVKYWNEGKCESYIELGVHQGGTASNILLQKPKKVVLVDKNLDLYREHLEPIAIHYCDQHNIELKTKECESIDLEAIELNCDMLLIDSYHKPDYMLQELSTHAHNIKKYIIAHDTYAVRSLHKCLEDFAIKNKWKVLEYNKQNVGYTVLGRK